MTQGLLVRIECTVHITHNLGKRSYFIFVSIISSSVIAFRTTLPTYLEPCGFIDRGQMLRGGLWLCLPTGLHVAVDLMVVGTMWSVVLMKAWWRRLRVTRHVRTGGKWRQASSRATPKSSSAGAALRCDCETRRSNQEIERPTLFPM